MRTLFLFSVAIVLMAALFVLGTAAAQAQVSDKILSIKADPGVEGQPLTIAAELARTSQVSHVLLAYRSGGSNEFRQLEATVTGNTASATVPGREVTGPVEYYFIVRIEGDAVDYTYPVENPAGQPLRVDVKPAGEKDKMIIFLSPEPGSSSTLQDLLVSVSLIRVDSAVKRSATKIFVDETDVTPYAVISEDLVTLVPENINPPLKEGPHVVKVELYGNDGSLYHKSSVSFSQVSLATFAGSAAALQYNVSAQLEARSENIASTRTPYNRATLNASSQYGPLQVNGRLYVTNEDKTDRQPQNRYYIEAKTSWLRAGFGDAYPTFPSLMMSGKRVRGLSANLALGFFNLDFAKGDIVRGVEGAPLLTFDKSQLSFYQQQDSAAAFGPHDTANGNNVWAKYRRGTFSRDLMAIRPSFGSGESFQWGFTYLKSKDNVGSIQYGAKPQENLAVGSDMTLAFDNRNFLITAQAGAGVTNNDIARGSITDSQIDTLFRGADSADNRKKLRDLRDMIDPFITVNQNIVPMSLEKITSIMAYEAAVSMNYFDNYLKAGYVFRGPQYNSFGASFLRKDVRGINIFDRIRLLQNQLFLSIGYEQLEDNLDASKIATATYTTWNGTVSYFPRFNFPNITVGYGVNENTNGLVQYDPITGPDVLKGRSAIEEKNTRYFVQAGYDFLAKYRHNAAISVSGASRDDQTWQKANTQSTTVSGTVTTTWDSPLQTSVGLSLTSNQVPFPSPVAFTPAVLTDMNYTTVMLTARYRMMEDRLRLFALLGPTFGDFKRTMWDASAEYMLMQQVWLVGEVNVLSLPGTSDAIWSLILRYNM